MVLELANEMWIFAFLTVVLLAVTMGYRKYWEHRQTTKLLKREDKKKRDNV